MPMPEKWTRGYRPDPAVLKVIDDLREAIAKGRVRALGVVTVNPMLDVECRTAGDEEIVRKRLLAAGLIELSQKLLK